MMQKKTLGKGVLLSSNLSFKRRKGEAGILKENYQKLSRKKLCVFLKKCDIPFSTYKEVHEDYNLEMYNLNNFLWFLNLMNYEDVLRLFFLSYFPNIENREALVCNREDKYYKQLTENDRKFFRYYRLRLGFDSSWFDCDEECILAFLGYICEDFPNVVTKNWIGPMRIKLRKNIHIYHQIFDRIGYIYTYEN